MASGSEAIAGSRIGVVATAVEESDGEKVAVVELDAGSLEAVAALVAAPVNNGIPTTKAKVRERFTRWML